MASVRNLEKGIVVDFQISESDIDCDKEANPDCEAGTNSQRF
jgi:hypothetical protein